MFGCSLECLGNSPILKIWTIQCQVSEYFLEGFLFWGLRIQEGFPDGSVGKDLPAMQEAKENPSNMGLMLGSGRSPGEGNGNPLQYSCLGNPMDRRACQAMCSPWSCKELNIAE